ncbi:MAG: proline dehydrogenase family protein [Bdellovibrionota bacterium]
MLKTLVSRSLGIIPKSIIHRVARRYVAGDTLDDAIGIVKKLNSEGSHATMDFLGEFVSDRAKALETTHMAKTMLEAIARNQLRCGISIKLTSLGLDIDDEFCYTNLRHILEKARACARFVRIDMENSPYTTRTLGLYYRLRNDGFKNTGIVLQAYMRRSETDLNELAIFLKDSHKKPSVRLCKGIYVEQKEIAFKDPDEIRSNYKKLLTALFKNSIHAAIATHDEELLMFACGYIKRHKIPKDAYEFQMLLGVRDSKRAELITQGHRVRVYVPFGGDWYGYSMRRLKENPEIAKHVVKAFLLGD